MASRILAAVALTVTLVVTGMSAPASATTPASAGTTNSAAATSDLLVCLREIPVLATGVGPVGLCYNRHSDGRLQAGYHSEITGDFTGITGWLSLVDPDTVEWRVTATDGVTRTAELGPELMSGYGGARWGVQFGNFSHTTGRFGAYNMIYGTFYPSSGWFDVW